jgi:hypothetical protein
MASPTTKDKGAATPEARELEEAALVEGMDVELDFPCFLSPSRVGF